MRNDNLIQRRKTRVINIGNVKIGGDNPIAVQSMTNTDTRDIISTVNQIHQLTAAGCEIIRVAVPDMETVAALKKIKSSITIPLIADIHFDYKLAIESIKNGADCIRINPGNIGGEGKTAEVIKVAAANGCAIRIGVNSGSLEKDILKAKGVTADALVESAIRNIEIPEKLNFKNYKVSIKASNVPLTVAAYRAFSAVSDVPLHIGVTEAGTVYSGVIKSAVGIGTLLLLGIGDTLRVSLTASTVEEVRAGWAILKSAGVRKRGVEIISCPTCGRTSIDLIKLAEDVESALSKVDADIKVAVMGCAVNGPGEAREADFGVAGGIGEGVLFAKGEIIKKVPESELLKELLALIQKGVQQK